LLSIADTGVATEGTPTVGEEETVGVPIMVGTPLTTTAVDELAEDVEP
jgi:hypothetical protein